MCASVPPKYFAWPVPRTADGSNTQPATTYASGVAPTTNVGGTAAPAQPAAPVAPVTQLPKIPFGINPDPFNPVLAGKSPYLAGLR